MPKKIFELAKELDIGALDLVEKLKGEGFNVRNHMNSLTDDEVTKVMALFAPTPEAAPATTKKKTKKKKTVKKGAKKKTAKKKTVLRKKGEEKDEALEASAPVEEEEVEEKVTKKVVKKKVVKKAAAKKTTKKKAGEEEEKPENTSETLGEAFGLRVVSRPEGEEADGAEAEGKAAVEAKGGSTDEEELYKEKVHKFTPVFIPEKKEETATTEKTRRDEG